MRATTQRGALLETLGKVKSAVAAHHTLPVVRAVLIRAGGGQLALTGYDLEVALTASCKANVTRQGAIVVLPKTLEAFLKAVKAETVTLSLVGKNHLKVEAGAITTIEGFEKKDYPDVPGVRGQPIEVAGLANGLKQVSYAIARDDSRPALSGVYFASEDGKMVLTASDGLRLAETKVKAKGQIAQTIVPAKAIQLVERFMPGKVSIHRPKSSRPGKRPSISFVGEDLVLTAMAIQAEFPNYKQIIPKNGSPLTVESKALSDALNMVSITLPDNNIVRLQTKGKNLIVSTKDEGKGETEVKVPARGKATVAYNFHFLKDLLAKTNGSIKLRISDRQSPGVVRQNGTIHVLMPMFVQW
jgi:DNA polymerase-3 subunit beta